MRHHQRKGREGERVAESYLKRHGFRIVGRNVRIPPYEIDLVAEKDGVIHLVEVKTSASLIFPEAYYTDAKEAALQKAADAYLRMHPEVREICIDLVAVDLRRQCVHFYSDIVR